MPISINIIDSTYLLLQGKDIISIADLIITNEYIYSEVAPAIAQFQLVDLSQATRFAVSSEDLHSIAEQDKSAAEDIGHLVVAIYAPKDLAFGLSRVWEVYAEAPGVETSVFRDYEAAHTWLLNMQAEAS